MIRPATYKGRFYKDNRVLLKADIASWLKDFIPDSQGDTLGLIVPHAGYIYSGKCAAMGMASIPKDYDSIILLHPSHHGNHFGYSIPDYTGYETPFGELKQDKEMAEFLTNKAAEDVARDYHLLEHSAEVQMPLIKYFFPKALVCPVLLGRQTPQVASTLADSLKEILDRADKKILIMVSTDLSHYHSADQALQLDMRVRQHIVDLDAQGLWTAQINGELEACGLCGIMTLLFLAAKYSNAMAKEICYTHSGETSGDHSQVVGYLSAKVLLKEEG